MTSTARTSDLLELVGALRSVPEAAGPARVRRRPARAADAGRSDRADAGTGRARERDDVARLTVKPRRTRRERRIGVALGAARDRRRHHVDGGGLPERDPRRRRSTRSSGPSRTPRPGSASATTPRARPILGNASDPPRRGRQADHADRARTPQLVTQTLDTFTNQATEAGDLLLADYEQHRQRGLDQADLHQFTSDSIDALSGLEASIPAAAHDALVNAAGVALRASTRQASNACPDCGEPIPEHPAAAAGGRGRRRLERRPGALAGGAARRHRPAGLDPADTQGGKGSDARAA